MPVAATPAPAADDFIEGVYLQPKELCSQAKKDTLQTRQHRSVGAWPGKRGV